MTTDMGSDVVSEAYKAARFKMPRRRWRGLSAELQRRGDRRRESGAFLLAKCDGDRVVRVAYYDDLDPYCLTGGISFASSGFTELWRVCGVENLRVVADVHTHPGVSVGQSKIDATNPMMARVGHVAMIVPSYGDARCIEECGVHIYLGGHRWATVPSDRAGTVVEVYGIFSAARVAGWTAALRRILRRGDLS